MNTYYIIYHSLIFIALVLAIIAAKRGAAAMPFLVWLLSLILSVELLAEYFIYLKKPFVWAYHLFVTAHYGLLCAYYLHTGGTQRRNPVLLSIPIFILFSLGVSTLVYRFSLFPGININVAGALLFIIFTHLLFNLENSAAAPVYKHPNFWIAIGVLLFFGGTFMVNGIYTPLLRLDDKKAVELYLTINRPLNLAQYSCFIIGLLCSIPKRKYILQ